MVDEDILKKSGADLFRELIRVYSVAELEDYFKAGIWKEDMIKADLQLVWAHRREAGAPDPPDLEDVPMPNVPKVAGPPMLGVRPIVPGGIIRPGGIPVAGALRPAGATVPPGAKVVPPTAGAAANGAASGPAAELKLIQLFITKWKLDPTKAKMVLAKMTPAKRRYVITNFKNATNAADATAALEQYIAQCEKTNAWGAAVAAAATAPGVVAPRPTTPKPVAVPPTMMVGAKRPIAPIASVMDASKRPRITPPTQIITPGAVRPAAVGQVRPVAAGARPAVPGVRPPGQQVTPRAAIRPVSPAAKAQEKPGNLIRSLLQKL
mmetsp:Transcript_36066/g.112334  ORF Transcript_36066/g.112334 Transcript_36066/m.112334 type:complete len:322 (+) Transcript_36066:186-1151(+)